MNRRLDARPPRGTAALGVRHGASVTRHRRLPTIEAALLLVLLMAQGGPLRGQTPAEGSPAEGALFLLLPVGAKAVGLGRAVTALPGAESVWWNPAGLGPLEEGRFVLYRGDHPVAGEATAASLIFALSPLGVLGASYQLIDLGKQDVTDPGGNVTGELSGRNHLGVLSLATRLRERLSVGVNLKLVQFRFTCRGQCMDAGVTATTVAVDVGAQLAGLAGLPLTLGAMVAHAGSRFRILDEGEADPLPTRLRLAAAYEVLDHFIDSDDLSLSVTAEIDDRWRRPGSPATYVGTEFTAGRGDVLYVRAGYVFGAESQLEGVVSGTPTGAAVGVGLRYESFDLGLAKSLATSALPGESEPVHISFGIVF